MRVKSAHVPFRPSNASSPLQLPRRHRDILSRRCLQLDNCRSQSRSPLRHRLNRGFFCGIFSFSDMQRPHPPELSAHTTDSPSPRRHRLFCVECERSAPTVQFPSYMQPRSRLAKTRTRGFRRSRSAVTMNEFAYSKIALETKVPYGSTIGLRNGTNGPYCSFFFTSLQSAPMICLLPCRSSGSQVINASGTTPPGNRINRLEVHRCTAC